MSSGIERRKSRRLKRHRLPYSLGLIVCVSVIKLSSTEDSYGFHHYWSIKDSVRSYRIVFSLAINSVIAVDSHSRYLR